MPGFQVWQAPGGLVWEGTDQEEAFLAGLRHRKPGVVVEVAEIYNMAGDLRPRRLAHYDGWQTAERTE
ncbi:MAG: hypothetical protein HY355_01045 [Armatimonadetes bacterium]|nr:hypothetical protein [Armatimonadota bacterium]